MNCNACGHKIDENSEICQTCGACVSPTICSVHLPPPQGAVNDYPGILTPEQFHKLDDFLKEFFESTEVPVVIAIVRSTAPLTPTEYAFLLFNHWGIGKEKVNKGALLLLALKERWLESEIGFRLERFLPEEVADWIIQHEFIEHFKNGNYYEGLLNGTETLLKTLLENLPVTK
jgi:uncharacterized protein